MIRIFIEQKPYFTMKILFALSVIFLSLQSAVGQVPVLNFEDWRIINGSEQPVNWQTNNEVPRSVSITKSTDRFEGSYALQLVNNGPSFEGPASGYATTVFTSIEKVNKIAATVKCDSLEGTGKGVIRVSGYLNNQISVIGYWETTILIPQYTLVDIPLNPVENYDSIRVELIGSSQMDPTGWPTGFVRLKIDQLKGESIPGSGIFPNDLTIHILPNPVSGLLNLRYPGGSVSTLQLLDIHGRVVLQIQPHSSSIQLDVSQLQKGLYIIRTLDNNGAVKTKRTILQ
ncbi:MAG: T9SS type A sorting domain-containing protein [Terrimonas sp.]|nr:T9SS type A sorting domain-containing protein [Terrimonas sp.]